MKKIYSALLIISMLVFDIIYISQCFVTGEYSRFATYLVLPFIITVPYFYEKITHHKLDTNFKLVYWTFIFFADFLGCVVSLYNTTDWFDVFTHFLSGVFTAFLAILLMQNFKYKQTKLGTILYVLGITCLVAAVWEIFEYIMDTFSGSNLQHALETGVDDTMEDMIAALGGSLLFLLTYLLTVKDSYLHRFTEKIKL